MTYDLADVPAIDRDLVRALQARGAVTTDDVISLVRDRRDRERLERSAGVSVLTLYRWARLADLMRIMGVTPALALLLERCAVMGIADLRKQDAAALARQLNRANHRTPLHDGELTPLQVENWIEQALRVQAHFAV